MLEEELAGLIVWTTVPEEKVAETIGGILVQERLAACVHCFPAGWSIYEWQGKRHQDPEWVMMIKTRESLYTDLAFRLRELHPYEVPEILAVPVIYGLPSYLGWMRDRTRRPEGGR